MNRLSILVSLIEEMLLFFKLRSLILQENVTVEVSIDLLKIILVRCVHRYMYYIQIHAQPSLFCETENLLQFRGLTVSRVTYHYSN